MAITRKKAALAALASLIIGAGGFFAMLGQASGVPSNLTPVHLAKTFDGAQIRDFSIAADTADIEVVRSQTSEIRVELTGSLSEEDKDAAKIDAKASGDALSVTVVSSKDKWFNTLSISELVALIRDRGAAVKVQVALPDAAYRALSFQTSTGDVALADLRADRVRIHTDTGNVTAAQVAGERFEANSSTGNLDLSGLEGVVSATTDTGNVKLRPDSLQRDITVKTDTGNVDIRLSEQPSAARFDFQSDIGDARLAVPNVQYDRKEKHRVLGAIGAGGPLLQVRTDTGDITVASR